MLDGTHAAAESRPDEGRPYIFYEDAASTAPELMHDFPAVPKFIDLPGPSVLSFVALPLLLPTGGAAGSAAATILLLPLRCCRLCCCCHLYLAVTVMPGYRA